MEMTTGKLSIRERLAYMCGDLAHMGLMSNFINNYLLFFFTNALGLTAAAGGALILIVTLCDAVLSPLYGWLVDRTRTKLGTYRPYLFAVAVPMGLTMFLCFLAPDFTGGGKLAYAYVVYALYSIVNSFGCTAYGGIAAVMTDNPHEHDILGSAREYGTNIGGVVLSLVAMPLMLVFSRTFNTDLGARIISNEGLTDAGMRTMALLVACFTAVCMLLCAAGCRERIAPKSEPVKFGPSLKSVVHNWPILCLALIVMCINALLTFKASMTAYFCEYYLLDISKIAIIMAMMFVGPLIGLAFVPKMVLLFKSKGVFLISGALSIVAGAVQLLAGTNVILLCLASLLCGFVCAFAFATLWGCVPDCAIYGQWKTGVYCPGMLVSTMNFTLKIATALAQFGVSMVLSATGFNAELAVQAPRTVHAIWLMTGLVPILLGTIAIVLALCYTLSRERVHALENELAAR